MLYVPTRDNAAGPGSGAIHAVAAADGSVSWTTETAEPRAPAATEDTVYLSDSYGLHALDPSDGSERWTFARGEGAEQSYGERLWSEAGMPASAPALTDAAVFVSLSDTLYALDRTDGSVLWECEIDNPDTNGVYTRGIPAVGTETVYFTAGTRSDQTVYAVDAATGEKRWTAPGYRTSIAVDDAVVVRSPIDGGDALRVLDEQTGAERWRYETGHTSMAAVDEDTVYCIVGFSQNSLVALDVETGETRWRQMESRGPYPFFTGELVVTGDTIYLGSSEGLLTLDKEEGAFLDVHEFADDNEVWPPVVANGVVYLSDVNLSGDGDDLYALTQGEGDEDGGKGDESDDDC
jgi:outer membrane protein assembly factor BamB